MTETRRTEEPVSIAYDMEGSGPVVVFLHGIGGNRLKLDSSAGPILGVVFARWPGTRGAISTATTLPNAPVS